MQCTQNPSCPSQHCHQSSPLGLCYTIIRNITNLCIWCTRKRFIPQKIYTTVIFLALLTKRTMSFRQLTDITRRSSITNKGSTLENLHQTYWYWTINESPKGHMENSFIKPSLNYEWNWISSIHLRCRSYIWNISK